MPEPNAFACVLFICFSFSTESGAEKGGLFGKGGLFRKVHFLEIPENLEILEISENPQTAENKGESDHFLEILENQQTARGASRTGPRQKTSKIVKKCQIFSTLFDIFRAGQKKSKKSKSVKNIFDIF